MAFKTRSSYGTLCWTAALIMAAGLFGGYLFSNSRPAAGANPIEVRVNQTTIADQQEPTLAVDPTNSQNVLAAAKDWRTGPKQVWDYRSTDGGSTWVDGFPNLMPSELPDQSDPVLAFDASGSAYLAVLGYNQSDLSVGGVFVSRSNDKGASWQPAAELSANNATVFNDKEWLTIDRSNNPTTKGTIYVAWTLFTTVSPTSERSAIVISRSTDGGRTFSPRHQITPDAQDAVQGAFPVVGPDGDVYVLYFNSPGALENPRQEEGGDADGASVQALQVGEGTSGSLYVVRSSDGGQTFTSPVEVASAIRPPSPLPGSAFRIFVLPVLAIDPRSSALYATWNDYTSGNSDVLVSTSNDGGRTWTKPVRVNDDPTTSQADQFFPTASVGSDGVLRLEWLDRRDDSSNRRFRPYYASSSDGGKTFTRNAPLTASMSDPDVGFQGTLIGDYISLDISNDTRQIYSSWVDTRGGNQDIYFTRFDASSGPPSPLPPLVPSVSTPVALPSPQPLTGFSDRAFISAWERPDRAVVTGQAQRPWVWGPVSFASAFEPYQQGDNGQRQVLYFDKARMEINNPHLAPTDPGYVTNGLLVVELMSGRIQIGNDEFAPPRAPSNTQIAGDGDSPGGPTYASLARLASLNNDNRASDGTGQAVTAVLAGDGQVTDNPALAGQVRLARYEPLLGHNIPDVFWSFMNATGPVYNGRFDTYSNGLILDWVSALGYPITEPYWTSVKVAGVETNVLVQAYQRRVLTYVASNPPGWQVEMGNVGRHYFDWRYGSLAGR